jgi:hypothetical protein
MRQSYDRGQRFIGPQAEFNKGEAERAGLSLIYAARDKREGTRRVAGALMTKPQGRSVYYLSLNVCKFCTTACPTYI